MKNYFYYLFLFASLVLLSQCSNSKGNANTIKTDPPPTQEGDINVLRGTRPTLICGQQGYQYLMNEYFVPQCAICHTDGEFSPFMSDSNVELSYMEVIRVAPDTLKKTVTENGFCGEDCNLDTEGETYKAIEEWLDNRFSCP